MIVALDGADGAGKTTQVRRIEEWAARAGISCRTFDKWQVLDRQAHPEARFLRATERIELRVCIAEMSSPARCLFIAWMISSVVARAAAAQETLVIVDGYWVKHAAAELIYGTEPALVQAIARAMAAVDAIIYLDVSPEEALRRKGGHLAPYECACDPGCAPELFLTHQRRLRAQLLQWATLYSWAVVDTEAGETAQRHIERLLTVGAGAHPSDGDDIREARC